MPAREGALRTAGFPIDNEAFRNSAVVEDPNLAVLGDLFAVPAGVPIANVFSIGDVLLVIGGGAFVHSVGGSRLPRPGRRVSGAAPDDELPGAAEPIDLLTQLDAIEAVALLSFLDKLSTWPTEDVSESVLASHLHAFSSLTRGQALALPDCRAIATATATPWSRSPTARSPPPTSSFWPTRPSRPRRRTTEISHGSWRWPRRSSPPTSSSRSSDGPLR